MSRLRVGLCPTFSMWECCQTPNLDGNEKRATIFVQRVFAIGNTVPHAHSGGTRTTSEISQILRLKLDDSVPTEVFRDVPFRLRPPARGGVVEEDESRWKRGRGVN